MPIYMQTLEELQPLTKELLNINDCRYAFIVQLYFSL